MFLYGAGAFAAHGVTSDRLSALLAVIAWAVAFQNVSTQRPPSNDQAQPGPGELDESATGASVANA